MGKSVNSIIVGGGEIGSGLNLILSEHYETAVIDIKDKDKTNWPGDCKYLNIAIRWTPRFIKIVNDYVDKFNPFLTIIHSSVYPGTTAEIKKAVHSPVNAKHAFGVDKGLKTYIKYIGYDNGILADEAVNYLGKCFKVKAIKHSRQTELAKLLCLTRYGLYLHIADEMNKICKDFNCDYDFVVKEWEKAYNDGMKYFEPDRLRPIYDPPNGKIGGHCTIQDMEVLLNGGYDNEMVAKTVEKYKNV